jgi:hypothetical protein
MLQWEAVPFVAAANGVVERVSTSVILESPINCPENKVTLSIYTDAGYPIGPGNLLASAQATVASTSCNLTEAKVRNGPSLVSGTKYWIVATTNASQTDLDARWYASNNDQEAYNLGDGWQLLSSVAPAFSVQGGAGAKASSGAPNTSEAKQPYGSNLVVDPDTGCNYDPNAGGFDVRGPDNCSSPGSTEWLAVSFVASRSGVPQRILAPIILHHGMGCSEDKVTLSLYTDSCGQGPETLLVSGVATAQTDPCNLALARLRNAPPLTRAKKYWVAATTSPSQSALDASWFASNNAQFSLNVSDGWLQFTAGTPAFEVR